MYLSLYTAIGKQSLLCLSVLQDFDKKVLSYAAQYYKMSVTDAKLKLPRIYTSSQHLSEVDFVRVYKAVDALVIPTHGEG